ncbi:MAG: hypothetical protein FJZ67_00615 [Bacteroidetes bacterium]|nr:hypothetical protein [Bacteroidota bacterium]
MLNSDYIHLKIKDPETCSSEDAGNYKELIELYPYASTFSILYLKSLANSGDIRLENELEKFAFRINDRSVLYKLIHTQHSEPISTEEKVKEIISEVRVVESSNTIEKLEEEEINVISEPIKSEPEEIVDIQEIEPIEADEHVAEQDELDKLITSAAIASTFVEKELESLPEIKQEVEITEIIEEKEKPETIQKTISVEEKIENSSPKSFTDWLKASTNSIQQEIEKELEEERKPEYYTYEKPKKEFFSPSKKAKESLDENKMPVSETLAKIFALQGNFSKAIYVYEQLILIFPEKKPFFATQIKNLKKKLNP